MAKKKKKRPPPQRSAASRPRAVSSSGSASGASKTVTRPADKAVDPATTTDTASGAKSTAPSRAADAQNRLARKEAARRQREALRRRAARRRLLRRVVTVGGTAVVLGALIYWVSRPSGLDAQERSLLDRAADAAVAAGCADVEEVAPYAPESLDRAHIGSEGVPTPPELSTYSTQPPASGPHDSSPMPAEIYPTAPPIYRVIHSMEHGAVVIWHRPDPPPGQIERISSFFREGNRLDKVIVAPYDYPDQGEAGQLPQGVNMALVAWHRMQTCEAISLPAAFRFVEDFRGGAGEAPEPGAGI